MSTIELNQRVTDLATEIAQVNEETKILTAKRSMALQEQNETAARTIRTQLQELQDRLEDLTIMKTAVEGKLHIYKRNATKAAEIRKHVAGELWPQGTKILSKMQQALADLSGAIGEIDQLNGSMGQLIHEHERLTGETVRIPSLSDLIPMDLRRASQTKLSDLPEVLELKFQSQEVEEKRIMERQQRADLIAIAVANAPICEYCEQPMKVADDVGRDGEIYPTSGRWAFRCDECKIVTNEYIEALDSRER
jgi:hypothetical protein